MHEVGIVQSLIEQVEKKIAELNRPVKSLKILVQLGKSAGVSSQALQFGFEIVKNSSAIPFAQLEIEEIPLRLKCQTCKIIFQSEEIEQDCPNCGTNSSRLISGKELRLKAIEYE